MHPVSFANTNHDVTDLISHEMIKNKKNLNILRTEHNFSTKFKKFLTCASDDTFENLSFCSGVKL